jgi:hypothetical protein
MLYTLTNNFEKLISLYIARGSIIQKTLLCFMLNANLQYDIGIAFKLHNIV